MHRFQYNSFSCSVTLCVYFLSWGFTIGRQFVLRQLQLCSLKWQSFYQKRKGCNNPLQIVPHAHPLCRQGTAPDESGAYSSSLTFPALMQTLPRGDSRRRTHTPDPTRRRRTNSSSSIPLQSSLTVLTSFLQSLTYFVASSPSFPFILLTLPTALFSVFFLLPFRPSVHAIRVTFSTPHLPILTALHVFHLVTTLIAIHLIGPIRALVALGSHPTIVHIFSAHRQQRTPRYLACLLFTLIALFLLAYDVSVDAPVRVVRDRVLQNPTARAVHKRIQTISQRMNLHALPFRRRHHTQHVPEEPLPETLHRSKPPADPPPPPNERPHKDKSNTTRFRRRLMAIVKGEELAAVQYNATNQSFNTTERNDSRPLSNTTVEKTEVKHEQSHPNQQPVIPHKKAAASKSGPLEPASRFIAALGVVMACSASVTGRAATEMRERVMTDAGDWSAVAVALFTSTSLVFAVMLMGAAIVTTIQSHSIFKNLFSEVLPRGIILSLSWLVVPVLLQVHGRGLLGSTRGQRAPKPPVAGIAFSSSMLNIGSSVPTILTFYFTVMLTSFLFRVAGILGTTDTVGALTYAACALFLFSSRLAFTSVSHLSRRVMSGSSGDLSAHLTKGVASSLQSLLLAFRSSLSSSLKGVKDLIVHARSNKASWQVLNFLILQTTMAIVELIYATITSSSGLFSISADNFFCSVALAIGLIAIRVSSRKPCLTFSYGYGRVESLCGFANGIILIYIGILVMLETFERSNEDTAIAIGRAFSVCLLGLIGNLLGLYFFPPESRRENHNVQGIYLHIWANTFAFARIALSTSIMTAVPKWKSVDMVSAVVVGLGMVMSAIPLLSRSGRLLLLIPSLQKEKSLGSTKSRLEAIAGVDEVSALRVWNLTPNSLVASVRLRVSRRFEGADAEILSRARAVFTMIRVAQSQCTIQITRMEDVTTESVVFLHKRSRSSVPDTGINVDMLATGTRSKTASSGEGVSAPAELTL